MVHACFLDFTAETRNDYEVFVGVTHPHCELRRVGLNG